MTHAEQTLSYETVKHLDAWLARNVRDETNGVIERVRADMLRLAASDETYWLNQGWWKVFDRIALLTTSLCASRPARLALACNQARLEHAPNATHIETRPDFRTRVSDRKFQNAGEHIRHTHQRMCDRIETPRRQRQHLRRMLRNQQIRKDVNPSVHQGHTYNTETAAEWIARDPEQMGASDRPPNHQSMRQVRRALSSMVRMLAISPTWPC